MEERDPVSLELAGALAQAQGSTSDKIMTSPELRKHFVWGLSDFIGKGGFGRVYLGTSLATGRRCAVKVVALRGHHDDPRWRREFDLLLKFDHPNIIKMMCCAVGETQGYIVTEAADTDLHMMLAKREGPLSGDFSRSCVEQMLFGLAYMHARDVIHRDVKPSNTLLLIEHLGATVVKLCDLGLARFNPSSTAGPDKAMTPLVQTEGYRAPEVAATEDADAGYCHPELDAWGVGCVALECLTRIRFACAGRRASEQLCGYEKLLGPCPTSASWLSDRPGDWRPALATTQGIEGAAPRETPLLLRDSTWQDTSEAAREFTMACLSWEYKLRPSAAAALSTSWLKGAIDVGAGAPAAAAAAAPEPTAPITAIDSVTAPTRGNSAAAQTRGASAVGVGGSPPVREASRSAVCLFGAAPTARGSQQGEVCACSGNCGVNSHRKSRQGCTNTRLAVAVRSGESSNYCIDCTCELLSCLKPRHRGPLCSAHKRQVADSPEAVRLHRALPTGLQERLIPVDVLDFVEWCSEPGTTEDLAVWLIVAWMKMPSCREDFRRHLAITQGPLSAASLRAALLHAMSKEDDDSHSPRRLEENRNLARTGATRTTGLAQVCRATALATTQGSQSTRGAAQTSKAKKRPREGDDGGRQAMKLGKGKRPYVVTQGSGEEILQKMLTLSSNVESLPRVDSAPALVETVRILGQFVEDVGGVLAPGEPCLKVHDNAYTGGYVVRLLTLGHLRRSLALSQGQGSCAIDWSALPIGSLQDACPDQKKILSTIAGFCSDAQEASEVMCSRIDWGLFVSMFGCLWQSVYDEEVKKSRGRKADAVFAELLSEIESEHFARAVNNYWEKWGFAPHPATALAESRLLSAAP